MRIALMESCFPGSDRGAAFRLARECGAQGLELVFPDERGLAELANRQNIEAIQRVSEQEAVAVSALAMMSNGQTDGFIRESAATTKVVSQVRMALSAAHDLGAAVVLLPFYGKSAIESEAELRFACDRLSELDEPAEQAGVVIGVETMLPMNEKIYLVDHTGGGIGVRLYYDVGNTVLRRLDPAIELRNLGASRICGVHFRDVVVREGQMAQTQVRLGEGQVHFPGVSQALAAVRYDGWVTLETPPLEDAAASAKTNVAFAKKVLQMN